MAKTLDWQRKEYKLTCISPVHVGTGDILKYYEYIYVQKEGQKRVYFLEQTRWAQFLLAHNLLDEYAAEVMKGKKNALYPWLQKKGISLTAALLQQICRSYADVYMDEGEQKTTLNDISCQMKDGHGLPYIPGSSIKGAIRTAILHHLIKKEPAQYQDIWQQVKANIRSGKWTKYQSQDLERRALAKLPQETKYKNDALQSVMRGIQVSDAVLCHPNPQTVILQKWDASKVRGSNNVTPHSLPIFRECIPAGTAFRFSIKLDKNMTSYIGLSSLSELWQWVREYTQAGLSLQQPFFGSLYKAEFEEAQTADICLGGGTGLLSKTVFYTLAGKEKEGQRTLATYLDNHFTTWNRQARQREGVHQHQRKDEITPRTLKLAQAGSTKWLLGLAQVAEVK